MGLEQDYVDVLRDKSWVRAARSLNSGDANFIAKWIEYALCRDCREGKMRGVADAFSATGPICQAAEALGLNRLFLAREDTNALLALLSETNAARQVSSHDAIVRLYYDHLFDHIETFANDPSLVLCTSRDLQDGELRNALKTFTNCRINPAIRATVAKGLFPMEKLMAIVAQAIGLVDFNRIAKRITTGTESNIHISRRPRTPALVVAEISLLGESRSE